MKKQYLYTLTAILSLLLLFAPNTSAQERTIEIVKGGKVIFTSPTKDLDYMTVVNRLTAPSNIKASTSSSAVTLTWDAVTGAKSYNIFRSTDGKNFSKIGTATTNTYTDKSPLSGLNYYGVQALGNESQSEMSSSSLPIKISTQGKSGIYLGITGFNQSLYSYPISCLTEDSKAGFFDFIDNLQTKKGTLLYYSAEQAIQTLKAGLYPSDLFNVALITFTDGLDQGSFMMNPDYLTDEEYMDALNSTILTEKVREFPITAYSIGIRGNDVSDVDKFRLNLQKLASSPENAKEVSNMDQVNDKFKEIAQQLVESSIVQTVNLTMPGLANGTRVRFTFDNVTTADNSQLYIEGTFNLREKTFTNVVYKGMVSSSGQTVSGTADGIFVNFAFEGVRTDNKVPVSKNYIKEWTYISSTSKWQINSEFDKDEGSELETVNRSAAIMLVLDCSSSLGAQFVEVQSHAKDFINTLMNSTGGTTINPDDPLPSDNLSTTPIDLSLAVTKDSVRYYVTKEEYSKLGNLESRGYQIDGVTVLSAAGNFIVALKNANEGYSINWDAWQTLYQTSNMPTKDQGLVMSARLSEINSALTSFGGSTLNTGYSGTGGNTWVNYMERYLANGGYYDYKYYYLYTSGGQLSKNYSCERYFRPVIALNSQMTSFCKDHLKLSIIKDGKRKLISAEEYKTSGIPSGYAKEGVYVKYPNLDGFIVELQNANSSTVNFSSAVSIYGSYLPSYNQGIAMSANLDKINSALIFFGGSRLNTGDANNGNTWVNYTERYLANGGYYDYKYYYLYTSGGQLSKNSSYDRYVHRVINCGDITEE